MSSGTSTRVRNPQGEGNRLREELIAAAGRVLADAPDGELSLRAVAREAGVAAPSVYLQFTDKTELVCAVIGHYFEQLRETIIDAMAGVSDPAERLREGCLAYCRFGLERPGAYHVLFQYEPAVERALGRFGDPDDAGSRAFATLVDAVNGCMAAGMARPGEPFHLATLIWTAMHGYLSLMRIRRSFPWQPIEDYVDGLLMAVVITPTRLDAGDPGRIG